IYIGVNVFDSSSNFVTSDGFVLNKAKLLAGTVDGHEPGDLVGNSGGPLAPVGVDNYDVGTNKGYFAGVDDATENIDILRINNPLSASATFDHLSVSVPAMQEPTAIAQPGSTATLDGTDVRLSNALIRGGHLWTSNTVEVDSSGASGAGDRVGSRWYDIQNVTSTPSLSQSGTIHDAAAT